MPQWLGDRYGDRRLTVLFAVASLLQITFLVLIVTALVLVLMSVLHISMWVSILIVVVLAFTSILLGGASLHVVSNSVQAMTMLAVAVLLVASGLEIFGGWTGRVLRAARRGGALLRQHDQPRRACSSAISSRS